MNKILLSAAFVFTCVTAKSQNYSDAAISFFKKFKTIDAVEAYALQNFPTLEDCRYVFKGNAAYTYFAKVTEGKKVAANDAKNVETFGDVKVESLSTEEMITNNGKNTEAVNFIKERFQPNVMFYMISLRKDKNSDAGNEFKYFVFLNCRWIMFPKPMIVLSNKDVNDLK